jgi:hypothetical protein
LLAGGLALLRSPQTTDAPCPGERQTITPTSVRLVPTVFRHQSWVGVRSADVHLGMKLFICTDGQLVGETLVDEGDLSRSVTTIGIPTRWVANMWLVGRLAEYRTPDRWLVLVSTRAESEHP